MQNIPWDTVRERELEVNWFLVLPGGNEKKVEPSLEGSDVKTNDLLVW